MNKKIKAFTLVEILIAIVIAAILASLTLRWYFNYQKKLTIEGETNKVYQTLKEIQLKAKTTKEEYCIDLTDDGKNLIIDAQCDNTNDSEIPLKVPFGINNSYLKVNQFGIWTQYGSVYAENGTVAEINCVKVSTIRVCEGTWNGTDCLCQY